jgi:cyclophilin family peptidyl-prolyl cis-trans isomerase
MKKLFFSVSLILVLSACTNQKSVEPVKPMNEETNTPAVEQPTSSAPNNWESGLSDKFKGAKITTNLGIITVEFYGDASPKTVSNWLALAQSGFYNGTGFHRVIKDFMIQGGDPNSKDDDWSNDGMGDPGYKFADEFNSNKLVAGSLAMANSGPNTNGSQFFIVTAESTPWLDGKHTNFGQVTAGMDVVRKIEALAVNQNDHPTTPATIESIELIAK